jgi:hypothetical protein
MFLLDESRPAALSPVGTWEYTLNARATTPQGPPSGNDEQQEQPGLTAISMFYALFSIPVSLLCGRVIEDYVLLVSPIFFLCGGLILLLVTYYRGLAGEKGMSLN